jgi:hypothetical protein
MTYDIIIKDNHCQIRYLNFQQKESDLDVKLNRGNNSTERFVHKYPYVLEFKQST